MDTLVHVAIGPILRLKELSNIFIKKPQFSLNQFPHHLTFRIPLPYLSRRIVDLIGHHVAATIYGTFLSLSRRSIAATNSPSRRIFDLVGHHVAAAKCGPLSLSLYGALPPPTYLRFFFPSENCHHQLEWQHLANDPDEQHINEDTKLERKNLPFSGEQRLRRLFSGKHVFFSGSLYKLY